MSGIRGTHQAADWLLLSIPLGQKAIARFSRIPIEGQLGRTFPFSPVRGLVLKIAWVDDVGLPEEAVGTGNGEVIPLLDLSVDVKRHPKGNRLLAVDEN